MGNVLLDRVPSVEVPSAVSVSAHGRRPEELNLRGDATRHGANKAAGKAMVIGWAAEKGDYMLYHS